MNKLVEFLRKILENPIYQHPSLVDKFNTFKDLLTQARPKLAEKFPNDMAAYDELIGYSAPEEVSEESESKPQDEVPLNLQMLDKMQIEDIQTNVIGGFSSREELQQYPPEEISRFLDEYKQRFVNEKDISGFDKAVSESQSQSDFLFDLLVSDERQPWQSEIEPSSESEPIPEPETSIEDSSEDIRSKVEEYANNMKRAPLVEMAKQLGVSHGKKATSKTIRNKIIRHLNKLDKAPPKKKEPEESIPSPKVDEVIDEVTDEDSEEDIQENEDSPAELLEDSEEDIIPNEDVPSLNDIELEEESPEERAKRLEREVQEEELTFDDDAWSDLEDEDLSDESSDISNEELFEEDDAEINELIDEALKPDLSKIETRDYLDYGDEVGEDVSTSDLDQIRDEYYQEREESFDPKQFEEDLTTPTGAADYFVSHDNIKFSFPSATTQVIMNRLLDHFPEKEDEHVRNFLRNTKGKENMAAEFEKRLFSRPGVYSDLVDMFESEVINPESLKDAAREPTGKDKEKRAIQKQEIAAKRSEIINQVADWLLEGTEANDIINLARQTARLHKNQKTASIDYSLQGMEGFNCKQIKIWASEINSLGTQRVAVKLEWDKDSAEGVYPWNISHAIRTYISSLEEANYVQDENLGRIGHPRIVEFDLKKCSAKVIVASTNAASFPSALVEGTAAVQRRIKI